MSNDWRRYYVGWSKGIWLWINEQRKNKCNSCFFVVVHCVFISSNWLITNTAWNILLFSAFSGNEVDFARVHLRALIVRLLFVLNFLLFQKESFWESSTVLKEVSVQHKAPNVQTTVAQSKNVWNKLNCAAEAAICMTGV